MKRNKSTRSVISTLALSGGFLLSAQVGFAADPHVLAVSKQHKADVVADGGEAWCQPQLHLALRLQPDSSDGNQPVAQLTLMNQLKGLIANSCPAARSGEMHVEGPGAIPGVYVAEAATGWQFSLRPDQSAVAAALPPLPGTKAVAAPETALPQGAPVSGQAADTTLSRAGTEPPAAVAPVTPPAVIESPKPSVPRDTNYAGALRIFLQSKPEMSQLPGVIRWWAAYRYPDDFRRNANQEFRLQPILDNARADLNATLSSAPAGRVTVFVEARFGTYDTENKRFPVDGLGDRLTVNDQLCCNFEQVPRGFVINAADLKLVDALPLDFVAAQAFVEKRTRGNYVERALLIAVNVIVGPPGFTQDGWGNHVATATLDSVIFFADRNGQQPLSYLTSDAIAARRAQVAAEVERRKQEEDARRRAEQLRQLEAQRDNNIRGLTAASVSTRLANWIMPGDINLGIRLNNAAQARTTALFRGAPVPVALLIQADASGREKVATSWPGHLVVSVGDKEPALSTGKWYLVRGMAKVADGDDLPPVELDASDIYACTDAKCADAAVPDAVVNRKFATATAAVK